MRLLLSEHRSALLLLVWSLQSSSVVLLEELELSVGLIGQHCLKMTCEQVVPWYLLFDSIAKVCLASCFSEFSGAMEYLKLLNSFLDLMRSEASPFASNFVLKSALGKSGRPEALSAAGSTANTNSCSLPPLKLQSRINTVLGVSPDCVPVWYHSSDWKRVIKKACKFGSVL